MLLVRCTKSRLNYESSPKPTWVPVIRRSDSSANGITGIYPRLLTALGSVPPGFLIFLVALVGRARYLMLQGSSVAQQSQRVMSVQNRRSSDA